MNRIEEIKEFSQKCKSDPVRYRNTFIVHGPSDIEYLLSKLEQAEKALETIKKKSWENGQFKGDACPTCGVSDGNYNAHTEAQQALNDIRS